jgi:site-specific recombinase XerC
VFCTRLGRPLSPNNVHKHFKELLAKAGLPGTVKIHDLRHTNLSHLLNNSVPITTVARRGGYRNPHVLLSIYAHADAEQDAIAADVAGALTHVARSNAAKSE